MHRRGRILYSAGMKKGNRAIAALGLCALVLAASACGKKQLNPGLAADRIARTPQLALQKEDVEIAKVTQVSGSEAVVETRLHAAFRMERRDGEWRVRELRLGHGEWERIEDLAAAIDRVKGEETTRMLDRVAEGIALYRRAHGRLPDFDGYVALSDLLTPGYVTPLIRLDSWRRPLAALRTESGAILLRSAGPDGRHSTPDDIRKTVP